MTKIQTNLSKIEEHHDDGSFGDENDSGLESLNMKKPDEP